MSADADSMTFDLHVHTMASYDSVSDPRRVLQHAKRAGLSGLAITDHDTVRLAIRSVPIARDLGLLLIPGTEIKTDVEDVLALFVEEDVRANTFVEVIEEIHAQGGLALLAHPFRHGGRAEEAHASLVDLVEGQNARYGWHRGYKSNARARGLARSVGRPLSAGSDAHTYAEIGRARLRVPHCSNLEEVRKRLLDGSATVEGTESGPGREVLGQLVKSVKLRRLDVFGMTIARALIITSLRLRGLMHEEGAYERAVGRLRDQYRSI